MADETTHTRIKVATLEKIRIIIATTGQTAFKWLEIAVREKMERDCPEILSKTKKQKQ